MTAAAGRPVRIGLVGFGKGGRYFHAPLIDGSPETVLTAAVTRSPQRRAELAALHPDAVAFDSLADMASAGGIDAVTVTTPLEQHVPLVREAIGLRLPVACDKPFAADAATARAVVEAAAAAGVPLTVYQNRRWDADLLTLAQVVASGALGELVTLESTMEQVPPGPEFSTETGGGVLLDFGSHLVDQVLTLLGPATSVHATWRRLPGTSFDDRFTATVTHAGGEVSVVTANWAFHGAPAPRFRALGTDGTYAVPACDVVADQLLAGLAGTDPDLGLVPQECWGTMWRNGSGEAVPSLRGDWCAFYTGFARAVRGEAPVPVDPWQSVAALELLDAARRSATTGEVVHLN